jgi:hypothetical protein
VIAFEIVPLLTPQWRAASPSVKVVFMGRFPAAQNDSEETVPAKWLMVGWSPRSSRLIDKRTLVKA